MATHLINKGKKRRLRGSLAGKVTMLVLVASLAGAFQALARGAVADRVLGQLVLTSGSANLARNGTFYAPGAVAIDRSAVPSRLYVADTSNNRVLGWRNAVSFENGSAADIVLGQPDFLHSACNTEGFGPAGLCGPTGVAVDAQGHLYVADTGNNRVLEYDSPLSGSKAANRVFGQAGSFATTDCNRGGVSAESVCSPTGVAVDAQGHLYVADTGNNRVLEYDSPLSGAKAANRILGQADGFEANYCSRGMAGLCSPRALALDFAGRLYVADSDNNRVLEYDQPLASARASRVFGQDGDFAAGDCNVSGPSGAKKLCQPRGVAVDRVGHLYVADSFNNRVLEFDSPLTSDTPSQVIGQGGSFKSSECNNRGLSAESLCDPRGLAVGDAGNLFVADAANNRVVEFDSPRTSTAASRLLGQTSFGFNGANLVGKQGLHLPSGIAVDRVANRVYVADTDNNRVLGWHGIQDFKNGDPAAIVIGQADFQHWGCNSGGLSARSLCGPSAVAVDGKGRLYVADSGNHRVLEYDSPFNLYAAASRVYGQEGSFATNDCDKNGISASSLCMPSGLAIDQAGHLYVVDTLNNRLLEYVLPLETAVADRAFGQSGSLTSNRCNGGGAVSAESLCKPGGAAVDGQGRLYVADTGNSRVLEFDSPTKSAMPSRVFGQAGSFVANDCNGGGLSGGSLCNPGGVTVDSSGRLYVADTGNSRVLEYDRPTQNTTADKVFGQHDFDLSGCNANGLAANSLCSPNGVALDVADNLYVVDTGNNRVAEFGSPLAAGLPGESNQLADRNSGLDSVMILAGRP